MKRLVMKFGGTSVADVARIKQTAAHIAREVEAGNEVCVVVSAMAGETNRLVALADEAGVADERERDVIVSAGEQVSIGLLAGVLQARGIAARSWLGWQLPIITDAAHGKARINSVNAAPIVKDLDAGRVAIVAGFQGINEERVATLGRGGSDTSAVALAAALDAARCDIYTDVDGVYTTDPNMVAAARRLERISYEEMLEMASLGAKVLAARSVELAMAQNVPLRVCSSFASSDDDVEINGTLICDEDEIMENEIVSGIAYAQNEAKITLLGVADKPGIAAKVFGPLAAAQINVDMIVQNIAAATKKTDITFTLPQDELARALKVLEENKNIFPFDDIVTSQNMAKVSIIGVGMRAHAGVAQKMFEILGTQDINIHVISTSEIKVSVLIDAKFCELAVRVLHAAYGLEG